MKTAGTDSRILSLAAEVAKSPEHNVPLLLFKLKGKKENIFIVNKDIE